MEVELVEELRAERLRFLGLELVPTRYKEDANTEGNILISALVEATPDESDEIDKLIEEHRAGESSYFPLYRVGVSDSAVSARFGRCLWDSSEGGARHLLRFVGERGDDPDDVGLGFSRIHQPELDVAIRKVAKVERRFALLLERLGESGGLEPEQIQEIEQLAHEGEEAAEDRDFDQAADLEDFF